MNVRGDFLKIPHSTNTTVLQLAIIIFVLFCKSVSESYQRKISY